MEKTSQPKIVSQPNEPTQTAKKPESQELSPAGFKKLSAEIKEVTTLYNIGVAAGSSLKLKEVIRALYKGSSRLIDVANFAIVVANDNRNTLSFELVFDQGKQVAPFRMRRSEKGLTSRVLATQAAVLIPDVLETGHIVETSRLHPERQIRSWLGVPILNPLLTHENAQGVIAIWSDQPNAYNNHDVWLLSAIGTQAAIAIRNARMFEASQRRARESTVLNDVARALSSTLHLDEVLTRIMVEVDGLLNVEAGSLLLTDTETGNLVFQIALGEKADEVKPFQVPKGQGIAGEVALTGKPLMVADTERDERYLKQIGQQIDFHPRNILCVPLVLKDQVIGVLEVMNKRVGDFTSQDMELLSSVASYAAVAIDNARLHENVLAERDRVIEVQEETRKQLARDLHDGPTQLVAGMMMSLDFCKKALEKDPSLLPQEFDRMLDLAKRASHQLRTALFQLRPLVLETKGLGAALETFVERRQQDIGQTPRLSCKIETVNPGGEISRQDGKIEATIFAIVQETVNNAIKHAQASEIVVEVKETSSAIYTQIRDNGIGFDVDKTLNNYERRGSLGMLNLQERTELIGGDLTIKSVPGHGTRITIYVPKEHEERLKRRGTTGQLNLPPKMLQTPQR
ncbi:MAG: GAF domain-containing protein [Anaerolineae bacterium]|nr:GAF domain-containing protein [Anaerolineae bacterium]